MILDISDAINQYNKYHSPEAVAKLIKTNKDEIVIQFSGPFCRSCGVYDWFEDLVFELKDKGIDTEIKNVKEKDDIFDVKFVLK